MKCYLHSYLKRLWAWHWLEGVGGGGCTAFKLSRSGAQKTPALLVKTDSEAEFKESARGRIKCHVPKIVTVFVFHVFLLNNILCTLTSLCPLPSVASLDNSTWYSALWGRNGWHYFNPSGAIFITCPLMREEQLLVAFHIQSCLFRAETALCYLSLYFHSHQSSPPENLFGTINEQLFRK